MPAKIKRGYSRAFTPHASTGKRYMLDCIPAGLWTAVRLQAKRDRISLRALILTQLREYVERGQVPIAPVAEPEPESKIACAHCGEPLSSREAASDEERICAECFERRDDCRRDEAADRAREEAYDDGPL